MGALALLKRDIEPTAESVPATRQQAAPARLSTEQKAKRDERWLFCRMAVDFSRESKVNMKEACETVAAGYAASFPILNSCGQQGRSALTYNNCRNWLRLLGKTKRKDYDWTNKNALVDGYKVGSQEITTVNGDGEFFKWFLAFYLNQNKLSVEECHRLASQKIRKENPFAVIPKIHQVRYRIKKLDPAAVALARFGEEHLKNNYISYIQRDWSDVKVNEIWISDHRQFDCAIKVWDEEKQAWRATRPWLCGFMDSKSWYMSSWQITIDSPNCNVIQDGLALGIVNHGRPDCLYTDNGKDFKAAGFSDPVVFDNHEHCILKELGIKVTTSLPYNGRAKTIERNFRPIAEGFDKYFSSYLGNRPGMRPDTAGYFYKHAEQLPNLAEFTECFAKWLELRHDQPNNGVILNGMTPREVFESGQRFTAPPMNKVELYEAFLRPQKQLYKVHRGPAVNVNKTLYYGECLWQHIGSKLMIKTDRFDPKHVFAYTTDGQLVGECETRQKIRARAQSDEDRALISEQLSGQRRDIKRAKTLLVDYTDGLNLLTPQELLRLEPGDSIVKVGEMRSVKGAQHLYQHFQVVKSGGKVPQPGSAPGSAVAGEANNFDFKEDKEELKMEQLAESITSASANEPDIDNLDGLGAFDEFINSRKPTDDFI